MQRLTEHRQLRNVASKGKRLYIRPPRGRIYTLMPLNFGLPNSFAANPEMSRGFAIACCRTKEKERFMRAVIQRVHKAKILIDSAETRNTGAGLVVFLGVLKGDTEKQAEFLARKITELRIFEDENEKMNLSLEDLKGDMLIVSNFTLSTDCKKGRRPSFDNSAPAAEAERLYDLFVELTRARDIGNVETGSFGAHMDVDVHNNGPVTIIIDTEKIGK